MSNFKISFANPWFLLLLIPAALITFIPHFRLIKRYRRTRNRITSLVLHSIVMILAIAVLAGINFSYSTPNYNNEIILLVDMSDSEEESVEARDQFINTVLQNGKYDHFTVGIVTFGFDQVYAAPLSHEIDTIYDQYLQASLPDTSASDLASALLYTKDLFNYPETAKIVLISDGKETDNRAESALRSVLAQGIRVDTAYIESSYDGDDVQIIDIEFPDYHVESGDECEIKVTVQSNSTIPCDFRIYDNDTPSSTAEMSVTLFEGTKVLSFKHTFETDGLHIIRVEADPGGDKLEQNNIYSSYYSIETFNNVLILERFAGQSESLKALLLEDERYQIGNAGENVTVIDISLNPPPMTIDQLLKYDQVIMNNIANDDLEQHEGFVDLLYSYVYDYGGGMLTVGGTDESGTIHAYNREDMLGTKYQEMLPVQAINYTPPVGVVVIIDVSGSMRSEADDGGEYVEWALAGARSCVYGLSERDYFGIFTISTNYTSVLQMTSCSRKDDIETIINNVNIDSAGTTVAPAYRRAVQALTALENVEKRHIVFVSDYQIPSSDREQLEGYVEQYYNSKEGKPITFSVVGINLNDETKEAAYYASETLGHGRLLAMTSSNMPEITTMMREDLKAPSITEVIQEPFNPSVSKLNSPLLVGVELGTDDNEGKLALSLGGFFGTKKRTAAELYLSGPSNVPLYAQWQFGKGFVGSFMCDMNGTWSSELLSSESGKTLVKNMIANLMPLQDIRNKDKEYLLTQDNYTNHLSVYSKLGEGQTIQGLVYSVNEVGEETLLFNLNTLPEAGADLNAVAGYTTLALDASNSYTRSSFALKEAGLYKIVLNTCNADGSVASSVNLYRSLSYSEEYLQNMESVLPENTSEEITNENDLYRANMAGYAEKTNGSAIFDLEDPVEVFANFITEIVHSFDPRYVFMILAIILMLTDIAVRKFKFKWPHELIRQYREKKENQ